MEGDWGYWIERGLERNDEYYIAAVVFFAGDIHEPGCVFLLF